MNPVKNTNIKRKTSSAQWTPLRYLGVYTLVFLVGAGLICFWFSRAGKTFVSSDDGFAQHFPALVYYSRYLRRVLKSILLEHRFHIPTWEFAIGEGSDIFQALQYYVIGDPFSVFSVLVPSSYIYLYYEFAILLRMWCSGAAFIALCLGTGRKHPAAVLMGAWSYAFCFWNLFTLARHPYFLNPMVYFPLLLLGVEKILARKRPYLFILTVTIAALSNFYFFYYLVLLTVLYVIARLLMLYCRNLKQAFIYAGQITVFSVLGLLMASIIFVPICRLFLIDARMGLGFVPEWMYPADYYKQLPYLFTSMNAQNWLCLGYTAPALLALFLLWIDRKASRLLRLASGVCLLFMLCPVFGQIFNGLSYKSNRWCWAAALTVCMVLTDEWDNLVHLSRKQAVILAVLAAAWCILCVITGGAGSFEKVFSLVFVLLSVPAVLYASLASAGQARIGRIVLCALVLAQLGGNISLS